MSLQTFTNYNLSCSVKCNIFIHGNLFLLNFPSESIYFTGVTGNLHQVQSERLLTQKHHMYMTTTISVFLLCFADEEGCKDTCPVSCLSGQKSPSSPFSISAALCLSSMCMLSLMDPFIDCTNSSAHFQDARSSSSHVSFMY